MSISNAPLPDQLADVRVQIKALQEREAGLKGELLAHPELRTGASWIAEIKTVQQQQTDWKQVREAAPEVVAEHTYPREITRVELNGVTEDGEIVSARKFRAAQETAQ